jgi:CheY-like chemotaxis protein
MDEHVAITGARLRRPRTLIVDDERDILELYEESLRDAGWAVNVAETGDEALMVAPIVSPDVIVLDLAMPGLDGFQTMQRLKLDPRATRIPIVVLSGVMTEDNARRAARTGAELVLTKPYAADRLQAVLEAIVAGPPPAHGQQRG